MVRKFLTCPSAQRELKSPTEYTSQRIFLGLGFILLVALPIDAQVYPKAEVSAGFSVLQPGTGGTYLKAGWQSGLSLNVRGPFAIATDLGAHYRASTGQVEALIGPQFSLRRKGATGFAHVLVGDMRSWAPFYGNHFAAAFGGGVDVNAGKRVAVRMIQFDFIPNTVGFGPAVRLGLFGIVIKLGQTTQLR